VINIKIISFQIFKVTQRGQKAEGKASKLLLLHTYVTYLRQTKTIDRNLLMIESLKLQLGKIQEGKKMVKPQDIARLYDIIIQVNDLHLFDRLSMFTYTLVCAV
jgi:hypothetical protein